MNICITNHDVLPQYICGIKRVLSILTEEWKDKCNVTIISLAPAGTEYKEYFNTCNKYLFPNSENVNSTENITFFSEVVKKEKIDIILHPYVTNIDLNNLCVNICRNHNIKLITALHFSVTHNNDLLKSYFFNHYRLGANPINWLKDLLIYAKYHFKTKKEITRKDAMLYEYLLKHSDKVVLLSQSFIPTLKNILHNENLYNLTAINNPAIITNDSHATTKAKKIIWCGRVEYSMKRVDRIMDIWKRLCTKYPDWELIIIGSGNIQSIRETAKKHKIRNITFTGSCDPTKYYKEGSILCMTSSTEGWGMVLIEAMQYGCVPIAYNSYTSLADILQNKKNGFIIPAFDRKEYIEKLEILMTNDVVRENMAKEGYESIKKFNHKYIANKWIELFNEVTKQ